MNTVSNNGVTQFGRGYFLFLLVFLGALSAFGPFVTDMYLPTLPSMADVFETTPSMVQMGLTASMIGLAVGQVFFGPLSDKFGRRPMLMVALALFALSTVACIYSPTIEFFIVGRLIQGLGGSGGIVMSRSVATDCYSGRELARILAIVGAINGVAPVASPVIGGVVSESIGWQGIFWILFSIGVVLLAMCIPFRESLPAERRHKGSLWSLMRSFPKLLKLHYFRVYILFFGFTNGVLFSYISSASFIIQNHFGFSEMVFSFVFAINAIGIGIGSALSLKFRKISHAAFFGACGVFVAGILQFAAYLLADSFVAYESMTFLILLFVGFELTSATALAMNEGKMAVGAASALFGSTGFLFGGAVSPLVGMGNIMVSTSVAILSCGALSLLFARIAAKREIYDAL